MRNEDIAEAMKTMEANFKQHAQEQLTKFTTLLEEHMNLTDNRLAFVTKERKEESSKGGWILMVNEDSSNLDFVLKN